MGWCDTCLKEGKCGDPHEGKEENGAVEEMNCAGPGEKGVSDGAQ